MKKLYGIAFVLVIIGVVSACKEAEPGFSPGAVDSRITGTWRLVERRFQKDSAFSVLTTTTRQRRDSVLVTINGQTVRKDTVINYTDTIFVRRDTSFYTTRRYPALPPQTLTFDPDGKVLAEGSEMTYFYPIRYFRVDSTFEGLGVNLYIYTNRANVSFRQGVAFQRDTLTLLPRCDQLCYLKLTRVR